MTWFESMFGFEEKDFKTTKSKFRFDTKTHYLTSIPNGRNFYVGPFTCPSVQELHEQLKGVEHQPNLGGLVFKELVGDIRSLHLDEKNANAVFMVASQFNALEMIGPGVTPENGVTNYIADLTQGPACALSCPGATIFRNYFVDLSSFQPQSKEDSPSPPSAEGSTAATLGPTAVAPQPQAPAQSPPAAATRAPIAAPVCPSADAPAATAAAAGGTGGGGAGGRGGATGQAGGRQLNLLAGVGDVVGGDKFWRMRNGYSLPLQGDSMARLGRLLADPDVAERAYNAMRVAVHWDTQVLRNPDLRVCQVFGSALPVSYCHVTKNRQDWAPFATLVLAAAYDATLAVAAVLAAQRGARVRVLLTRLGGGAFGNSAAWINQAMEAALRRHSAAPLDVFLVKFGSSPHT